MVWETLLGNDLLGALDLNTVERMFRKMGGWKKVSPYLYAILVLLIGYLSARLSARIISRVNRPWATEHGVMVVKKIVFYAIFLFSVLYALHLIKVNLSALLAAAGVATVAISFAAQTSVSNVISGIFLLFDRPFSIGDTIKVDTTLGSVLSVGMLSSKVRTFDNLVVRIPNEVLLKSTIINYSLLGVRRVDINVGVAHDTDIKAVQEMILEVMREHDKILDEPAPAVLTDLINESGVQLLARVWVVSSDYIHARSELSTAIIARLNANKIRRPIMQRVVYLRQEHGAAPIPEGAFPEVMGDEDVHK